MAETFNKKERNKKKLQKRKEKEQRRDEKRLEPSGKSSMEDMIAYVDENGNLSATPPDPQKARKVALDDIAISTPREIPPDPDALLQGVVTYFDAAKGYGFISNTRTQERVFVHVNQLADPGISLATGNKVEYAAQKGPRGLQAELVRKI